MHTWTLSLKHYCLHKIIYNYVKLIVVNAENIKMNKQYYKTRSGNKQHTEKNDNLRTV